jgi:hypothetical protein
MSSTAQQSNAPTLTEYDFVRAAVRVFFAILIGSIPITHDRGLGRGNSLELASCSGRWGNAFEFFAPFLSAVLLIEIVQWAVWRAQHRAEVIASQNEIELLNKDETAGSLSAASVDGPREYRLAKGGGLIFAPRKPIPGLLFAFSIYAASVPFATQITWNTCTPQSFSWIVAVGWLLLAYATLAIGNVLALNARR